MMYANARPGGSLEALSGDLLRQARQLADGGPAEDELQRVKKVSPGAESILPRCHAPPAVPPPDRVPDGSKELYMTAAAQRSGLLAAAVQGGSAAGPRQ